MKVRRIDLSFDEWIAGTVGLSEEQEGIYIRLTARHYSRGRPLETAGLAAYCNSDPRRFWRIVNELWRLKKVSIYDHSGTKIEWTSPGDRAEIGPILAIDRCEVELKSARDRMEIGAKLALKRWKTNGIDDAAPHMRPRNANHQPSTINHHINPPNPPSRGASPNGSGARRRSRIPPHPDQHPSAGRGLAKWAHLDPLSRDELWKRWQECDYGSDERTEIRDRLSDGKG